MIDDQISEIKEVLSSSKKIVLVPHRNPDGDAMGSCLAMNFFLKKIGHNSKIVAPNDYPEFLKWMPGSRDVLKFDKQNRQSKKAIDEASIVFLLDFNSLSRVGSDMQNTLEKFKGDFIMIDHHHQPDDIAKYLYSDPTICATAQMVYHFFEKLDVLDNIDKDISTCLYTGILMDTGGSFRFSTTSTTHKIIADLIDKGANNSEIFSNVYDSNSLGRIQLLGHALSKIVVLEELNSAYITLSKEELEKYNYQKGDTEGVVNYALSIKGIIFASIFIEDTNQGIVKISFRSKGSFSVNKFSRAHFNGGGHDNAAGGRSDVSLEKTVEKFLETIYQYKNELNKSYEG